MGTPGGRRLRPLALICALLFVLWGAASAGSLVAQIMQLNEYDAWPDENADGEVFAWTFLFLSAAASGCWVAIWGLFGLAWRPPLHFGFLALLVAVAQEVAANQVQAGYFQDEGLGSWSFGDQLKWYGDRVTFESSGLFAGDETAGFFIALPLVTVALPFVAYLIALFSGAGRKRKLPPSYGAPAYPQQAYAPQQYQPQQYQQPVHQQPPAYQPPAYQPPPQPRVPWQQVPPVVPPARPAPPPRAAPPDQETLPYHQPPPGR